MKENKANLSSPALSHTRTGGLRPAFTPLGIWAFSIGTSIGWGSFIVTCSAYLLKSGVLGTIFGLLLGMAVILVITWNLQYMIRDTQDAGGIYSFEKKAAGKDFGFLSFWFILLTYLAVFWANITSLPLFARFFLGNTFRFGLHYRIFGYEVWLGEALLSILAVVLTGLLCAVSTRLTDRVMIAAALTFAIAFAVCAVIVILRHESTFSYAPLYTEGSSAFGQIVRIAVISPWAFIGFENIAHFSEEYSFPVKKVRSILIWSVGISTVLYVFVSLLSVSAYPPEYESWIAYIRDMGNLEGIRAVPAFYAASHYLGQAGVAVLMLALFGVILTSLIGNMLALSRLLYAAGRDGEAPSALSKLSARQIPVRAIEAIVLISFLIPFLGRTAIGWIVDVTTIGATLIYGLLSYAVCRQASRKGHTQERITGAAGVILMICFLLLLLIPGLLPFHAIETESYILFIVWAVLGLAYYRFLLRRGRAGEYRQRMLVWILLLLLVLFASMMWVSRATESAADRAVRRIYEYHETHAADGLDENGNADRVAFLQEQARQITSTNTLYTIVSLGLFILVITMLMNNYRETRRLGERLTEAESAAEAARKIAELKESISSLLDNMPSLNFSKDAETGIYLACNQAFAEYAHKRSPDGVVGLTDAEIFDAETAAHFVEDDRMALSMEEPYIFYEDVPDAAGNQRQFQTTKLKFIDSAGRLCLLGMCQDVTDMVRLQRESATTKEAYERARSTSIMYTHIAQALVRGYTDLFYVNLDTEEFIEYRTDGIHGSLSEKRRGYHFFDECRTNAMQYVFQDDREIVLKALERRTLLQALERNNIFMLTYRLMSENGPVYASMSISRMEDDNRFIIIGVTNIDEQMKQRRTIERAKEERLVYTRLNALTGDFLCVYTIVPETGRYREYSTSGGLETLSLPKAGSDFFGETRTNIVNVIHPSDLDRFLSTFTREKVLGEIEKSGIFALSYRLMMKGKPMYVKLKAAIVEEHDGRRLVVGVNDIDAQIRQEEAYAARLAQAQSKANIDALTGVKNRHAYLDAEEQLDHQIAEHRRPQFAIVILDVNNLKTINDTEGHKAGDEYIRSACRVICNIFKRSPVFRVGGDEFAVIAQGNDYSCIEELIGRLSDHNTEASESGGVIIACGMAKFEEDSCVANVFERADQNMYEDKSRLKGEDADREARRTTR